MTTTVVAFKPPSVTAWLLAAGAAAWTAGAPIAAADPVFPTAGAESAGATIADLKAQGFDVAINWVAGPPNVPLSECMVTAINNPDSSAPNSSTVSTVYVDVACPNAK